MVAASVENCDGAGPPWLGSTCSDNNAPRTSLVVSKSSVLLVHTTSEVPVPGAADAIV
jgi:hypothetical protein